MWPVDVHEGIRREHGRELAAIRVSVGVATDFADVYRLMCFLQRSVDRRVGELGHAEFGAEALHPSATSGTTTGARS